LSDKLTVVPDQSHNDPLHGITLEQMVTELSERHGWDWLAERINVQCFKYDPCVKSSLKFLRKTPWARTRVEQWYAIDLKRR
jgi:uncharacterized protein (DUF2132 family)